MGWRFHKSTKVGPFRLNFSKKGVGWSVGAGGVRYTHRADGRRTVTSTIRGTGISYVTDLGKAKPNPKPAPKVSQLPPSPKKTASSGQGLQKVKGFAGWVFVAGGLATLITLFSGDAEEIAEVGEVNLFLYMVVCFAVGIWFIRSAKRQKQISNLPERNEPLEDDIEEAPEVVPPDDRYEPRSEAAMVDELVVRNRQDAEVLAPQCLRQANETADILNNTTNPDTFFSRYDFLIGRLEVLSNCEAYISFTGEKPSVTLARVGTKSFHEKASRQLIDRCFDKSCEKIASLKTERGKRNEAERFNRAFESCSEYLNDALRQYQQEKYSQLVQITDGEAAPASTCQRESSQKPPQLEAETDSAQNLDQVPAPKGAELSYLDIQALDFWNGKKTSFEVPQYYMRTPFGENVKEALPRLLDGGYLEQGDLEQRVSLKKVPELKAILSEHQLKVSGTKKELVQRIMDHFDPKDLEEMFPENVYHISEKGRQAMEPYSIIRDNDAHSLGLSYYRLMKAKEAQPDEENNVILTRLLSEDIQKCFQEQNRDEYQRVIGTTGRFMREVGEYGLSFECYALAFFVWVNDPSDQPFATDSQLLYYMAKNVEQAGKLCGYSFDQLCEEFEKAIQKSNPFALDREENRAEAISKLKEALGL